MMMSGIAGEMPLTHPTPGPLPLARRAAGYWNMPSTGSVRSVATGRPALVDGWHTASNRSSAGRAGQALRGAHAVLPDRRCPPGHRVI
jgi:hypothetical protein